MKRANSLTTPPTSSNQLNWNLNDINILRKHISTYKALRPVYDKYVKSNNKAKFEKEHQREIILFKASHKYLSQEQTDRKLPTLESVNVQRMELEEQRQKLYTDYRKAKKEVSEIDIVKANVDAMLHTPQRMRTDKRKSDRIVIRRFIQADVKTLCAFPAGRGI